MRSNSQHPEGKAPLGWTVIDTSSAPDDGFALAPEAPESAEQAYLQRVFGILAATLLTTGAGAVFAIHTALPGSTAFGLLIASLFVFFATWAVTAFAPKRLVLATALLLFFAALEGLALGPALSSYLALSRGPLIVGAALGSTGLAFAVAAIYTKVSGRDFSFLAGFLFTSLLVVLALSILAIVVHMPLLEAAAGALGAVVFVGYLFYDLARIWAAGMEHPVQAAITLYLDLLNLFMSLLRVFAFLSALFGED